MWALTLMDPSRHFSCCSCLRINNDPAVTSGIPLPLAIPLEFAHSVLRTKNTRIPIRFSSFSHFAPPNKTIAKLLCCLPPVARARLHPPSLCAAGYGFSYVVFCCSSCCCLLTFFQHKKRSLYTTTIIWIPSYSVFFSAAHR